MSDLSADTSLSLDTGSETVSGNSGISSEMQPEKIVTPEPIKDVKEPVATRDILRDEMKKEDAAAKAEKAAEVDPEAKPDKDDAKPAEAKEEKPAKERAPDGKFAAKDVEGKDVEGDDAKSEVKPDKRPFDYPDAPKNFTPEAKERWSNVPRSVRRDIETLTSDYDRAIEHYRGSAERYEEVRELDDHLRANGGNLKSTLDRVAALENLAQSNPLQALQQVLQIAGPRKADGNPLSLYEVAQYIVQNGQEGFQKAMQPAPQAPQEDPRIGQLQQQIAQMEQRNVVQSIIDPFRDKNRDYDELQGPIAAYLNSGMISDSLAPAERLAIAYGWAKNGYLPTKEAPALREQDPTDARVDTSGGKSIKSAPGSVSSDHEPVSGGSIRELLDSEMKRRRFA